ncbi:MAG: hypothetical protein ACFB6S_17885 [Geminicoccaceae bacterium]
MHHAAPALTGPIGKMRLAFGAPALLWVVGWASLTLTLFHARHFIYDDAYISLRYAHNLIEHGELVWNLGEPVEGYTNFLYLLATSGLMAMGVDGETALRLINALSFGALVWLYLKGAGRLAPAPDGAAARAIGGLFLLGATGLPLWVLGGLEAVSVGAFQMAAILCLLPLFFGDRISLGRLALAGAFFALAYLCRPDAVILAGAVLTGILFFAPLPLADRLRAASIACLVLTAFIAIHLAWRLDYYGEFLPNTYHAKVGVDRLWRLDFGFRYTLTSFVETPVLPVALVLAGLLAFRRMMTPPVAMLAFALVCHTAYVIWAGGDHLPVARFYVPVIGLAALLVAAALVRTSDRVSAGVIGLGLVGALLGPSWHPVPHHRGAEGGLIVGRWIDETWPEGSLIALSVAGATPYVAADHRFVDMLGLSDKTIARRQTFPWRTPWQERPGHAKGDGAYVLSREPDYIVIGPAFGVTADQGYYLSDVELAETPLFHRCYTREVQHFPADHPDIRASPVDWGPMDFTYYRRIC